MWKRLRTISALIIALCLILCVNALPVNADSNQGNSTVSVPELPSPPAGFNPLTATALQLKEYGFPARPSDSTSLAEWTRVMSYAKYYVKPVLTQSTTKISSAFVSEIYQGTGYSQIWSGYMIQSANNNNITYSQAWGDWTQPGVQNGGVQVCCWVGLGGWASGYTVQAGAITNTMNMTGSDAPIEFALEDTPNDPIFIAYPQINAGDEVYAQVTYNNPNCSSAFLLNFQTYQYTSINFYSPYYDGSSAEYIYENMDMIYSPSAYIPFKACDYVSADGIYGNLSNSSYTKIIMTDNGRHSGAQEAVPGAVTNSNFYVVAP
jgi:hypothetical protein